MKLIVLQVFSDYGETLPITSINEVESGLLDAYNYPRPLWHRQMINENKKD